VWPGLFQRKVTLPLAVVLQTKERQTRACKSEPPFRQNCGTDVQYLADAFWVVSRIQQSKRPGTFPQKSIDLTLTANNLKGRALLFCQGHSSCLLVHDDIMPDIIGKAVRPSDSED
jgi:hypothetical protein